MAHDAGTTGRGSVFQASVAERPVALADLQAAAAQLDPNVVSQDVTAFIATGVLAYLAHAFYNSMFRC